MSEQDRKTTLSDTWINLLLPAEKMPAEVDVVIIDECQYSRITQSMYTVKRNS